MNDNDKYKLIYQLMLDQLNEICATDRYNPFGHFVVDTYNQEVLTNLTYYLAQLPGGKYDLNKGIIFMGTPGTGKTIFLEMMSRVMQERLSWNFVLVVYTATAISSSYYNEDGKVRERCHKGFLGINDLGYETPYKSGQNPIKDILFDRYEKRLFTYATTNLDPQGVVNFYRDPEGRLKDRLPSMFNIVALSGPSRRQIQDKDNSK
jgi:DNA replication protein DnaC